MHRTAVSLLGGGVLVAILPVLFTNVFVDAYKYIYEIHPKTQSIYVLIFLSFAPLGISYYFLLKDLIQFYFIANLPSDAPDAYFFPRYVLTGLNLPLDELKDRASLIDPLVINPSYARFFLPAGGSQYRAFGDILRRNEGKSLIRGFRGANLEEAPDAPTRWRNRIYVGLRLAGSDDRSLVREVAKMELSLARHALLLRDIVLRYIKAFMLFLMTLLLTYSISLWGRALDANRGGNSDAIYPIGALPVDLGQWVVISFLAWSILSPYFVTLPMRWISKGKSEEADPPEIREPALAVFEQFVVAICSVALLISAVQLVVSANINLVVSVVLVLACSPLIIYWYNYSFKGTNLRSILTILGIFKEKDVGIERAQTPPTRTMRAAIVNIVFIPLFAVLCVAYIIFNFWLIRIDIPRRLGITINVDDFWILSGSLILPGLVMVWYIVFSGTLIKHLRVLRGRSRRQGTTGGSNAGAEE